MDGSLQGYDALRARLARVGHVDARLLTMLRLQAVREAKARVKRKTGNLGRTIGSEQIGPLTARLYARAKYAQWVEEDTKPHDIAPLTKKALAFASQSALVSNLGVGQWTGGKKGSYKQNILQFRKTGAPTVGSMKKFGNAAFTVVRKVHHPGTKGQPFLVPGGKAAIEGAGLAKEIVAAWDNR